MSSTTRRRAILHIGIGKTGSTTLQHLLAAARERLVPLGFAYPLSPGRRNHLMLAVAASEEPRAAHLLRTASRVGDARELRQRFAADLGAEMAGLPAGVHTVIFSSEHLSNQATSIEDVARLKALLDGWFDDYRILVYLRRQDEYEVSLYSTLLRSGKTGAEILPPPEAGLLDRHDLAGLLDRWGAVFGRGALMPRLFDRDAFVDGDLLADMRAACGLPALPVPQAAAVLNTSLTAPAQEFLRRLNIAARGGLAAAEEVGHAGDEEEHAEGERDAPEETGQAPTFIREFLGTRYAGAGRRPSRAEAEAFVARHAAGNERIRAEFFPDRTSLFSTDFSRYPETADPLPVGEALMDVALAVVQAQDVAHGALIADTAARRGRERLREAPEEARRLFRRALGRQPTHLGALRGLVELAGGGAGHGEALSHLARAIALEPERPEFLTLRRRLARQAANQVEATPGSGPVHATPEPEGRAAAARPDGDP
ncbi:MAG: hypothetical protein K2X74_20975, partial [Acetobacteraceae bacterium]|nr:hypothetical protein [Acetobacteraceae bacterium]